MDSDGTIAHPKSEIRGRTLVACNMLACNILPPAKIGEPADAAGEGIGVCPRVELASCPGGDLEHTWVGAKFHPSTAKILVARHPRILPDHAVERLGTM
jgi:hypothetical protein